MIRIFFQKGGNEMISFETFVAVAGSPIYQQIIDFIKRGIVAGRIECADVMPSRRVLSAFLGVNPNTVQKAYRMLEEEGLVISRIGAKSIVRFDEQKAADIRTELLQRDAGTLVRAMKETGLQKQEALQLVERFWEAME